MKKKALIIDDDEDHREVVVLRLKREGFETFEAADGEEGVDAALKFKPDLVLVDLMMPKLHGYGVCEMLRAEKSLSGVRILVTSSKSYDNDIQLALNAGADAYLIKPYHKKAFLEKIRKLMGDPSGTAK